MQARYFSPHCPRAFCCDGSIHRQPTPGPHCRRFLRSNVYGDRLAIDPGTRIRSPSRPRAFTRSGMEAPHHLLVSRLPVNNRPHPAPGGHLTMSTESAPLWSAAADRGLLPGLYRPDFPTRRFVIVWPPALPESPRIPPGWSPQPDRATVDPDRRDSAQSPNASCAILFHGPRTPSAAPAPEQPAAE